MKDRYRLNYGKFHDEVNIADDEERVYLWGLPVGRLNEYDHKCKVMAAKLEELGYKLIFIKEDYNMSSKKFETTYTTNPSNTDAGEWMVVTLDQFNKFIKKGDGDE